MGRDKPKKYSKMGYFEKEQWKKDEARKRGIEGIKYTDSRGNPQTRVNEKALKESVRNDFDYRTSSSHMDGAKGNGKFNDFTKYQRGAVKLHKQAGNGGEFSSTEDITTVTNNLVKDYRNKLMEGMSVGEQQKSAKKPEEPYQESEELSNARQTVEDYDNKDFNVYNKGNATGAADAGDGDDQRQQAAQSFLGKYKLDLKNKVNLRPTL